MKFVVFINAALLTLSLNANSFAKNQVTPEPQDSVYKDMLLVLNHAMHAADQEVTTYTRAENNYSQVAIEQLAKKAQDGLNKSLSERQSLIKSLKENMSAEKILGKKFVKGLEIFYIDKALNRLHRKPF